MIINTDIALEFAKDIKYNGTFKNEITTTLGIKCTRQNLSDKFYAEQIGKRAGIYNSYEFVDKDGDIVGCMASGILSYKFDTSRTLLVGIGNPNYTVDSLGNETLDCITLVENAKNLLYKYKPLCSGETGIDSFSLIKSAVDIVQPTLLIAIDSLVTLESGKLGNCYQITNAGLVPGSGSGAKRQAVSKEELGVDILAIGVPLALSIVNNEKRMIVTRTDIDKMIKACAKNIAESIRLTTF